MSGHELAGLGIRIPDYDETWSRFLTDTDPHGRTHIVGHTDWRAGRTDAELVADGYRRTPDIGPFRDCWFEPTRS